MSLFSTAPFSNVTTYKKDYYKKTCDIPAKFSLVADYKNPITGPAEEHVLPNFKYQKLPQPQTRYPDPKEYADHVAEKFPSTRIYLRDCPGGPPDLDVIDNLYIDDNRTTYMISYCKRGDYESEISRARRRETLPPGWFIPLTSYTYYYRPPRLIAPKGLGKVEFKIPKSNLEPNKKEREILEVKTGETVYISDISNTGAEIIKGKLHGDVDVRPKFDEDDLLRAMLIRRD